MIDTHVHLWDTARMRYAWLADDARPIVEADLRRWSDDGRRVVLVEAGVDTPDVAAETRWFSDLAATHPAVHGFVAAIDLLGPALGSRLDDLQRLPGFVGVRHLLQDTDLPATRPAELSGALGELARRGIVFDACVRAPQLGQLRRVAERAPGTVIVLDHMGKPPVGDPEALDRWRRDLARLADLPEVHCKLSGLPAECVDADHLEAVVAPIVGEALGCFGPDRCLVGSDWPVSDPGFDWCSRVLGLVPDGDRRAVAETNALTIYRRNR